MTHKDLRLLVGAVKRGEQPPEYDFNQDGRVDVNDARCFSFKINGFRPPIGNKGTSGHNIFEPPTCHLGEWIFLGENRYFIYQGANLLGEYNDQGEPRQEIFWMNNQPVGLMQDDALYFIHSDHLGAPRAITDANQSIVWRWESRPFGDSPAEEDPDGDGRTLEFNLRFPGQYYDRETGLFYNYFRDYDPATGRYIESDPIGLQGGLNTYLYANANPTKYVDPTGHVAIVDDVIIIGGTIIVGACIATNCTRPIGDAIGNAVDAVVNACKDDDDGCEDAKRFCHPICVDECIDKGYGSDASGCYRKCMRSCLPSHCADNY